MIGDLERPPRVSITTNGTQWSPRIEKICDRVPMSFVVSLDGITKETYESIRVGAEFDEVMGNLHRFHAYARRHGTSISIAHCLMRPNYLEFVDLLRFVEELGLDGVGVNVVLLPADLSLFQMEPAELARVVQDLDRQDEATAHRLVRFRSVWETQLGILRSRLLTLEADLSGSGRSSVPLDPWHPLPLIAGGRVGPRSDASPEVVECSIRCQKGVGQGVSGEVHRPIIEVLDGFEEAVGKPGSVLVGQPISVLPEVLAVRFGPLVGEPVVQDDRVTATYEHPSGRSYEGQAVFIDEGDTLLIVITMWLLS